MPPSPAGGVFELELIEERAGMVVLRVTGPGVERVFGNEAGGHRWQRRPKNDKHDRVHSSTVTVAVLAEPTPTQLVLREQDLEIQATRGSGPGGQNRNKVETAIQIRHKPTGLLVRSETERSQHRNKEIALASIRAKLWEAEQTQKAQARAQDRRQQLGSGMRGDKRRTVQVIHGMVTDHVTGKKWSLRDYLKGEWSSF